MYNVMGTSMPGSEDIVAGSLLPNKKRTPSESSGNMILDFLSLYL